MKMEQTPKQELNIITRFYMFLQGRDARIVELFFLGLNTYILGLVILPPYTTTSGLALFWRVLAQGIVTSFNLVALIYDAKRVRIVSSILNAAIMALVATSQIRMDDANAGTYALLAFLAAFVCWKINIR